MINSAYTPPLDLVRRPRRNRQTEAIRAMVREHRLHADNLIQPIFVKDGTGGPEAIASMPGIERLSLKSLLDEVDELAELGIRAVALFPQVDPGVEGCTGKYALSEKNWFFGAIRKVKREFPEVLLIADVALDPYTDHGHDGNSRSLRRRRHDETVHILTHYATRLAEAGADMVAPSDMMDGRIGAIRDELDRDGFTQTSILAYAAKFASAYYGPFREAVGSAKKPGQPPARQADLPARSRQPARGDS